MFKNHLKIFFRNARRNKVYSFINVAGLAIGIAVCFLIQLWVRDELSYDRFHDKADRIHRVLWDARYGDNEWTIPLGPVPVGDVLRSRFQEVESVVQFRPTTRSVRLGDESLIEKQFYYADGDFFEVFDVRFLAGDPKTALADANAVILTQSKAQLYFPGQNPLEQLLELSDGTMLQVKGVVADFPSHSHFHFDFLAPLATLPIYEQRLNQWGSATVYTYFVLRENENAANLESKLAEYLNSEVLTGNSSLESGNRYGLPFQAMTEIHLNSNLSYELAANGNLTYVYLFSIIGVFIIILACINFVNLSTSRSLHRAREVGIRKVLGSQRVQLVRQFFAESFLYVALAALLAITLTELALPAFNDIVNKQLATDYFGSPTALALLLIIVVTVGILSGAYPALLLSGYTPVQAFKGKMLGPRGGARLRNGLVLTQFCISVGLIVATLIVSNQLTFMQNKNLGFDKEQLLVVHNTRYLGAQHTAFKQRLSSHPRITGASSVQGLPGQKLDSTIFEPEQPANYENSSLTYVMVDEHFVDVLGLTVLQGRNFSRDFATDSSAFLINASAAEALGWEDPLGKTLRSGFLEGQVVGVVEDYHFESLHHQVKPIILPFIKWRPAYVVVKLGPGGLSDGIDAVSSLWSEFVPHQPFQYSFLDQDYDQLYRGEQRMARVFTIFATLAIVIACLGLFGLASFIAERRTKEVGVRKTLGASTVSVAVLLSRDLVKLVLFANLLAWPITWFAMNRWLEDFAYRVGVELWTFLVAGGVALVIAVLTVSSQALRAALANPVDTLRYE